MPGRHGPARLSHYVHAHQNDLEGLVHAGFVDPGQTIEFETAPEGVAVINDEDAVPHLGDVIREARRWYYSHLSQLRDLGLVGPDD